MDRINGSSDVQLFECTNPVRNYWRIRFDVQKNEDGSADYMEHQFQHKPSLAEIKSVINNFYNEQTDVFSLVFNMKGKWYGSPQRTKQTTRLHTTSQYKHKAKVCLTR